MKNILIICLITFCNFCIAQDNAKANRTITITGSASMEIMPDSICLQVQLSDYSRVDGSIIKKAETEAFFLQFYKGLKLSNKLLLVSNIDNERGLSRIGRSLKNSKKSSSKGYMYEDIYYNIWFKNYTELEKAVAKLNELDNEGIDYSIADISFSKLRAQIEELKLKTVQDAKEKATKLAASINEQIGNAMQIGEVIEHYNGAKIQLKGNRHIDEMPFSLLNYRKMVLYFEVPIVFALK